MSQTQSLDAHACVSSPAWAQAIAALARVLNSTALGAGGGMVVGRRTVIPDQ